MELGAGMELGVLIAAGAAAMAVWTAVPPSGLARLGREPGGPVTDWLGRVPDWGRRARAWILARTGGDADAVVRAGVAQVCELLAICLDAGRPPRAALRVVARVVDEPSAGPLEGVLQQIDLGVDEAQAWAGLASTPGYRGVARDLARGVHSGLGLSATLRQHAADARRDALAAAQVVARAAGVKAVVPLMLCFLPAFLLLGVVPIFGAVAAGLAG